MMRQENVLTDDAIKKSYQAQDTRGQRAWWLGRIRQNVPVLAKGHDIREIHDVFWDIPSIVIGAGPSLDKNINHLAAVYQQYPTFCCDRALQRVMDAGIKPTFVVNADGSDAVASFFDGCELKSLTLIAPTYASPRVISLPWRKIIYYNVADFDDGFERAAANISAECGKTFTAIPGAIIVGNIAFLCAKIAGGNPITFIGNDLCSPTPFASNKNYESTDSLGNKIYSLPGFLSGLEWILNFTRVDNDIRCGKLKLYNSTEGGIMYADTLPGIPLAEFIRQHPGSGKSLNAMLRKRIG